MRKIAEVMRKVAEIMYFLKCIFPKCVYPKCIFAKCTRLACLLSFASLLSSYLTICAALLCLHCIHNEREMPTSICVNEMFQESPTAVSTKFFCCQVNLACII